MTALSGNSQDRLAGLIRVALETWQGDYLTGPWDGVIDGLAGVIAEGAIGLDAAARLDHLLRRTANTEHDKCPTCDCSAPGLTHGPVTGEGSYAPVARVDHNVPCPDPCLHATSADGKCRYCRKWLI